MRMPFGFGRLVNVLLIALACWNAWTFLTAHQAQYAIGEQGRQRLTHAAAKHVDFISEVVQSGSKVTWVSGRRSYLVDLSLQRLVNPVVYPTTVDYSGALLGEANVAVGSRFTDRQMEKMAEAERLRHPLRVGTERGDLVAWDIAPKPRSKTTAMKEAKHVWRALGLLLLAIPVILLVNGAQWRRNTPIEIFGFCFLAILLGLLTWVAFSTQIVNSAESGVWIMRAKVLAHQGPSGFLEFITSSTGRYHAPTYPPLHPVLIAVLALFNGGFHPDLGRLLAICALAIFGYALLQILRGNPYRWGLTLILITLPLLLRCTVWGLAEPLLLALIALALMQLLAFLDTGEKVAHYKWLIMIVLASLVKIEGTLLALIFLGLYLIRFRTSGIKLSTAVAIGTCCFWPLWVFSQHLEGDFALEAALNRGWSDSLRIILDTSMYLIKLPFNHDEIHQPSGILLITAIAVNIVLFKQVSEKWLLGGLLIYGAFFLLIFPLSRVLDRADIVAWHLPALARVMLPFEIFLIVLPFALTTSKRYLDPSLQL